MADKVVIDEDEERRQIVHKYEQGREKILDDIADWEDPTNEAYHVTDRYGFIHDYKLPEKLSKYESQVRELEISRRDKWIKLLGNWDHYVQDEPKKLRRRIYKGIPNAVRGKAWCCLLGVQQLQQQQDGRYDELWQFGKQRSPDIRQIDLDINRTFRNNQMFRERYNPKQQELFRVLVAYSVYNCEIGYCQGMSQIAALLLMFTSEEEAFWCLDRLMSHEKYAMHGFFIPGFPKLTRFAKHHDLVLKRYLPRVCKHLKKFDIDSTLYTLKWFFQCFLDRVPFSLTLRIWDCFMLDGETILTCMSYTLLKLHKKTLLRKGMEDLIHFLQIELEKDFGYHDDEAIQALDESISELKKRNMHLPKEAASDLEKPSKPFGILLQTYDTLSLATEDRSVVGSIVLKQNNDDDTISNAGTSRTASEADLNDLNETSDLDFEDNCKRKLSVYDNVDLNESIEAAKRLSLREDAASLANSRPTTASITKENQDTYFDRDSTLNTSIDTVEARPESPTQDKKPVPSDSNLNNSSSLNEQTAFVEAQVDTRQCQQQIGRDDANNENDETTLNEDLNAIDTCTSDKENRQPFATNQSIHSPKLLNGLTKSNKDSEHVSAVLPSQSPPPSSTAGSSTNHYETTSFKRKTSIPKLKHNSKHVRPVGEVVVDSGKITQIKSPVKALSFKPMSSMSSQVLSSSASSSAASTQVFDHQVTITSPGQRNAVSPTSPPAKASLIPRLQTLRSPNTTPSVPKPTGTRTLRSDCVSPPMAQSPPECNLNAVDSGSLERRLNLIKSNMHHTNDGRPDPLQPNNVGLSHLKSTSPPAATDRHDSAKLRIYVPYVKLSGSSNHGSNGSISTTSNSSLHAHPHHSHPPNSSTVGSIGTGSRNATSTLLESNAQAKSNDESNYVRINVNDDLKTKSYLPRIDT